MIVPQAVIDQILGKARLRTLEIPVRRGAYGELKRCPLREGNVYELRPQIPYDEYRVRAMEAPTRAQAVLLLIDECWQPRRSIKITVVAIARNEHWIIVFELGDHSYRREEKRLLVRHNGSPLGQYTSRKDKAMRGEPEAIPPALQDVYSEEVEEANTARLLRPIIGPAERIQTEINELRAHMRAEGLSDATTRRELQRLERSLDRLRTRIAQAA